MGAAIGRVKKHGGKGVMVNYRYADGAKFCLGGRGAVPACGPAL
jgi:hypothetical protein